MLSRRLITVVAGAALSGAALGLLVGFLRPIPSDPLTVAAASATGQPTPTAASPTDAVTTPTPDPAPTTPTPDDTGTATPTAGETPLPEPANPIVDRRTVGQPWGTVEGLTTFRGNPTRTFYGTGPVPHDPQVQWRAPERAMCSVERLSDDPDDIRQWCGTGWTGQPLVWERPDGVTEVIVGSYDHTVRFLNAVTGAPTRPPFRAGHMVKGTETLDPDGYPLLYTGARDGKLRILALDRDEPAELWALPAHPQRVWNNDWDASPAIVNGVLYTGGEDSWFYAVQLNRSIATDGSVKVDPEVLLEIPGFTEDLFSAVGDRNVSIENSVALYEGRAYFANSGGRVVGLDVSEVEAGGEAEVVFDFWAGDDIDATITIDSDGMLYVAVELQRFLARAQEVDQLLKLDPYTDGDPVVWSVEVPPPRSGDDGGIWATPALHAGALYVPTHAGELLGVDTSTGHVFFREDIGYHEWGSPAVVDNTLVVPLCQEGGLRAYDVSDPYLPVERWTVHVPTRGCVESTPAIWQGRIYVGARDGFVYAFADD